MRLTLLDKAQGLHWAQWLLMTALRAVVGFYPAPCVFLTYRRKLFGKHFARLVQQSMREVTAWSKAEIELIASFTAAKLECEF